MLTGSISRHYDKGTDEDGKEIETLLTGQEIRDMTPKELAFAKAEMVEPNKLKMEELYTAQYEPYTVVGMGPGGMPGVPRMPYRNPKSLNYYTNLKIKNA